MISNVTSTLLKFSLDLNLGSFGTLPHLVPRGAEITLLTQRSFFTHHRLLSSGNLSEQKLLHPFSNCIDLPPFQLQGKR